MEKKANWDFNIGFILGCVFTFIGVIYLGICYLIFIAPQDPEGITVIRVFLPIGSAALIAGLALLIRWLAKKQQADRLIAEGRYVWGTITALRQIRSVNGLHGHPCVACVHYTDSRGQEHLFQSRYIHRAPNSSIIGRQVSVYIPLGAYAPYYVDIEPVLSQYSKK